MSNLPLYHNGWIASYQVSWCLVARDTRGSPGIIIKWDDIDPNEFINRIILTCLYGPLVKTLKIIQPLSNRHVKLNPFRL